MGQKDKCGVALQTALGTKATTMDYWPPVTEATLEPDRQTLEMDEALGLYEKAAPDMGSKTYGGTIAGAVRPTSIGCLLSAAFGAPTTSTVTTGVYSHVWDVAAGNPLPFSTMCVNGDPTTAIVDLFYDAYINALELSAQSNDYMMFSADVVALHLDDSQSNPSSTLDGSSRFTWAQLAAQIAVSGGSLGDIDVSNWRFRRNTNIEVDDVAFGDTEANGVTRGVATMEGSFTATGKDNVSTHYRRALLDSPADVRLVLTATGGTISGAHKYTLTVDIKKLRYTKASKPVSGSDPLKNTTVDFGAYLDGSQSVVITLKNADAGTNYAP